MIELIAINHEMTLWAVRVKELDFKA